MHAALRPAPFRSAEPARPGRGEGGTQSRPSQPLAPPPPGDPGPQAAPHIPERAEGGRGIGTGCEGGSQELAESRAPARRPGAPPAPDPACRHQTWAARRRDFAPLIGQGPQLLGRSAGPSQCDGPRGTGESPAAPRLAPSDQAPQLCLSWPRPGQEGLRTEVRGGCTPVSARPCAGAGLLPLLQLWLPGDGALGPR